MFLQIQIKFIRIPNNEENIIEEISQFTGKTSRMWIEQKVLPMAALDVVASLVLFVSCSRSEEKGAKKKNDSNDVFQSFSFSLHA